MKVGVILSVEFLDSWRYCPVCADVYPYPDEEGIPPERCSRCGAALIDSKMAVKGNMSEVEAIAKQHPMLNKTLYNTFVKQEEEQQERDRKAYEQRKELEALRKQAEIQEHLDRNDPRCPICQSFDVRRISGFDRATSILALGIFSKKINKSYKCNHCGSTF